MSSACSRAEGFVHAIREARLRNSRHHLSTAVDNCARLFRSKTVSAAATSQALRLLPTGDFFCGRLRETALGRTKVTLAGDFMPPWTGEGELRGQAGCLTTWQVSCASAIGDDDNETE